MSRRMDRVNVLLRQQISELLAQELKDPRIKTIVSITRVDTSVDLRHARVSVSVMGPAEEKAGAMAVLNRAAGFLRRELRSRVVLKNLPDLHFVLDESLEEGSRVLGMLDRLAEAGQEKPNQRESRRNEEA